MTKNREPYRMGVVLTFVEALRQFFIDLPNALTGISFACLAWVVTQVLGLAVDWPVIAWLGICGTGLYYHFYGLRELIGDLEAILKWPDHDDIDTEVLSNQIRREQSRLVTKSLFLVAGVVMLFTPPRFIIQYKEAEQLIVILLICGVIALDIDAVMDRRSRRRQITLIKESIKRRQARRALLEQRFLPVLEAAANQASTAGRKLVHDINGKLSFIVGVVDILKNSKNLSDEEVGLLTSMDGVIDEVIASIGELQELVRHLAVTTIVDDGSGKAEGSGEAEKGVDTIGSC
jgi:hypothetical protein